MAKTPSTMMPLGTIAPDFTLLDTISGDQLTLQDIKSDRATVVIFMCNHCPFVIHICQQLVAVARQYQAQGVQFIAISANDVQAYPADAPDKMRAMAQDYQFPFPYLYDETQAIAKAYDAACTPDFFVFNQDLQCVYRGQFDGATPGNDVPVTGAALSQALECLLAGKPIPADQKPSVGCNIKWKN